jgi:hypothetical protein
MPGLADIEKIDSSRAPRRTSRFSPNQCAPQIPRHPVRPDKWLALVFITVALSLGACATPSARTSTASRVEYKRITQLDLDTNKPIKYWTARSDTIHQHVTPPVGISFTDAFTGQPIHFDGTYKIESYRLVVPGSSPAPSPTPSSE